MKKLYSFAVALLFVAGGATAQCVVDSTAQTTPGVNRPANTLPCVERGVAFDQTVQGKIQEGADTTFNLGPLGTVPAYFKVDSVIIDSIGGLPAGISAFLAPAVLYGGSNGCVNFNGTTTDPTGLYYLTAYGTVWLRAQGNAFGQAFDRAVPPQRGNLNQYSPFGEFYLHVIETGDPCNQPPVNTGINDISSELNAALSVYPNPSNGVFEVRLNAGGRVSGDVNVVDVTGRIVYSQRIDVNGLYTTTVNLSQFAKGLYTVQVKTATGIAAKSISVE